MSLKKILFLEVPIIMQLLCKINILYFIMCLVFSLHSEPNTILQYKEYSNINIPNKSNNPKIIMSSTIFAAFIILICYYKYFYRPTNKKKMIEEKQKKLERIEVKTIEKALTYLCNKHLMTKNIIDILFMIFNDTIGATANGPEEEQEQQEKLNLYDNSILEAVIDDPFEVYNNQAEDNKNIKKESKESEEYFNTKECYKFLKQEKGKFTKTDIEFFLKRLEENYINHYIQCIEEGERKNPIEVLIDDPKNNIKSLPVNTDFDDFAKEVGNLTAEKKFNSHYNPNSSLVAFCQLCKTKYNDSHNKDMKTEREEGVGLIARQEDTEVVAGNLQEQVELPCKLFKSLFMNDGKKLRLVDIFNNNRLVKKNKEETIKE